MELKKFDSETQTVEAVQLGTGRVWRTVTGVLVIAVDITAFAITHVVLPVLTKEHATWGIPEIVTHVVFFGLGLMLIDKKAGIAVIDHVLVKLPGGRS